jgi:hypothetical protein
VALDRLEEASLCALRDVLAGLGSVKKWRG